VQGILGVSEGEIREALKMVVQELGGVVEPSAAVPLAAVMFSTGFREWIGRFDRPVSIGIILTGGNVSMEDIFTIISGPSTGQM
jgi:threonine dehydratase